MEYIWKGYYAYLDEDNLEVNPSNFEIRAILKNDSFEGKAFEEEFSEATNELVYVKGFFENDIVSFVKTYPFYWHIGDNGEVVTDRKKPGHQVSYFGKLDPETLEWKGDWEIEADQWFDPLNLGEIEVYIFSGPWKMKKVN